MFLLNILIWHTNSYIQKSKIKRVLLFYHLKPKFISWIQQSTNIWNILILVFRLGHAINALVSYFAPLVDNAIGCASNMVNSKQQVLLLDQTKTVAECAQQLLYASKESGGNPKVILKKKTFFRAK